MVERVSAEEIHARIHLHLSTQEKAWRVWHEVTLSRTNKHDYPRADIWALRTSWSPLEARVYEVKVSRSDFLSDRNKGKFEKYLPHCTAFYYAVPKDLVKSEEVPDGLGLVYVAPGKSHLIVKQPQTRVWNPNPEQLIELLMGIGTPPHKDTWRCRKGNERLEDAQVKREIDLVLLRDKMKKKHSERSAGRDAASAVANARKEVEAANRSMTDMQATCDLVDEIGNLLGVSQRYSKSYHSYWRSNVLQAIRELTGSRFSPRLREALKTIIEEVNRHDELSRSKDCSVTVDNGG
jgi:hypothetical protein